jgi:hypothetical protein
MIDQGIEPPAIIEAELSSSDKTSDSAVSENGVPDTDLKFLIDSVVSSEIENRRTARRHNQIKSRFDFEAINNVLKVIEKYH